ncbi:phytanoyl-CoA dioxygenase family protein [Engelhardtia mirabilis]|uniref:Phytanoyl-CoA dioxygenase (PhyH) n=1 Tax=Engelhardtia mirabilis TaxID=2528011 RepID=A0A518BP35_9BACT|nr:Phytanoyl-CoA dioxygenase (PhyH) [Planctomycetes bacterium Pla133]QDV03067.1 Phytanoyl-CoA dioxygenase (PhyH) [Planctomycetes bacterium Pla86]
MGLVRTPLRVAREAARRWVVQPLFRARVDPRLGERPWYDTPDAERRLAELKLDASDRARLEAWRRDGLMVLEGAIDEARLEALSAAVEAAWSGANPRVWVEHYTADEVLFDPLQPHWRSEPHKLLDLHLHSAAAGAVLAAPGLARWLHLLLGPRVDAFQSLVFERGTEQAMHRDTNFVGLTPPWQMVATWIALEDIEPGSGELEYYLGSNHLADYRFADGGHYLEPGAPVPDDYSDHWHGLAAELGLERRRFLPKRGDVLIWHAGLVHGGSPVTVADSTRRSLVTHFCPRGAVPAYAWDRRRRLTRRLDSGLRLTAFPRRRRRERLTG